MMFKRICAYLFKNEPVDYWKLGWVFLGFMAFTWLIHVIEEWPTELYRIKEIAIEDVDFNDIYYYTHYNDYAIKKKKVVLINTGSLDQDHLKEGLLQIINTIKQYKPKAIGVDILFQDKAKEPQFVIPLVRLVNENNVILGTDGNNSVFKDLVGRDQFGYINLPEKKDESVRTYYYKSPKEKGSIPSFATVLSMPVQVPANIENVMRLRYYSIGKGYYDAFNPSLAKDSLPYFFPVVEAKRLLENNNDPRLQEIFHDKVVLFGQLGTPLMNSPNNSEDRHCVATDFSLVNRIPNMPGILIHANAIQMLMGNNVIKEVDGMYYWMLRYIITFFFLFAFVFFENKIRNIIAYILIEITFLILTTYLLIWFAILLMHCGYHIKIGGVLFYIALLIEFKIFAFNFYKYLGKPEEKPCKCNPENTENK